MTWGRRAGARGAAVVVTGVLVAGGSLLAAAPAGATTEAFGCKVLTTTLPWNPDIQVVFTPSKPKVGQQVSAVLDLGQYKTGPVPLLANSLTPKATVKVNGSSQEINGGKIPKPLGSDTAFDIPTMKFSFIAKADNTVDVTKVFFDHTQVDTICNPNGSTQVATLTATSATTGTTTGTKTTGTKTTTTGTKTTTTGSGTKTTTVKTTTVKTARNLARTGPDDTRNMLIASLVALQLGLIVVVRMTRRAPKRRLATVGGPVVRVRVGGKR